MFNSIYITSLVIISTYLGQMVFVLISQETGNNTHTSRWVTLEVPKYLGSVTIWQNVNVLTAWNIEYNQN